MKRSGDPFTDGVLSTPLEPIIEKIDDFIPGFYALFNHRLSMRYRIANLVLGDNLSFFFVTVIELCDRTEFYSDELTKKRLSFWVRRTRRRMSDLLGITFKEECE